MDRAEYALKLMAEGKLNLTVGGNRNLEIEQMKLRSFRNNIVITFWYCNCLFISILIIYGNQIKKY